MKKLFYFITLVFISLIFSAHKAPNDSPITSTFFADAYKDHRIVKHAAKIEILDKKTARYLLKKNVSIDVKAAIVNAISWDIDMKNNADEFKKYIEKKYKKKFASISLEELPADVLLCLGYFTVLDNYSKPKNALPYLKAAQKKAPKSFTVNIILALTQAQIAFETDWCKVWTLTNEVLINKELTKDMRKKAIEIIVEYMILYKNEC